MTYTSAELFIQDMIAYQDNRMCYQPNAILSRSDGVIQLSVLTALKALVPKFWGQDTRNGPFVLSLADLHKSNMFVDDDWNIVGVIDLEFAPVQPIQFMDVPYWLANRDIESFREPAAVDEFKVIYDRFVAILQEEETARQQGHDLSERIQENWNTGRMWYNAALRSVNAFPFVFENNIQPIFLDKDIDGESFMRLWTEHSEEFLAAKVRDKAQYEKRVRGIFAEAQAAQAEREAKVDESKE